MTAASKRSRLRKGVVVTLKILGVFLFFVAVGIGMTVVWLRTDSATDTLTSIAQNALQNQGLRLEMADVSGPLPQELTIKGFQLFDDKGLLISADELRLRMRLSALLRGNLEIEEIHVGRPEVFRLPQSGSQAEEQTGQDAGGTGIPVLPVGVVLDTFAITDGKLHVAALHPAPEQTLAGQPANGQPVTAQSQSTPLVPASVQHQPDSKVVSFAASLSASLHGTDLSAVLKAGLKDAANQGVDLDVNIQAGVRSWFAFTDDVAQQSDSLGIVLHAEEAAGGPVSLLAGSSTIPGFTVHLEGTGTINDWRAQLDAVIDPIPTADTGSSQVAVEGSPSRTGGSADTAALPGTPHPPALLSNHTDITLRCATGSFWEDLVVNPEFRVLLGGTTSPGTSAPDEWKRLMGKALGLTLELNAQNTTYTGNMEAKAPAFHLAVRQASFGPYTANVGTTPAWHDANGLEIVTGNALSATIEAVIDDFPALTNVGVTMSSDQSTDTLAAEASGESLAGSIAESANPPLPSDQATVPHISSMAFSAALSGILAQDITALKATGTLDTVAGGENFAADLLVSFMQDGDQLHLDTFSLKGLGISADATAEIDTRTQAVQADLLLDAADHQSWQMLVARFAGLPLAEDGTAPLGGALHVTANFAGASRDTSTGTLQAVQPQVSGTLRVLASDMRWPSPQLDDMIGKELTVRAALRNTDDGSYSVRLEEFAAGIFSATGDAALSPVGEITADVNASVSNLAPLAGHDSGISGPLAANATAKGPMDNLDITLALNSNGISLPAGTLSGIDVKARAHVANADQGLNARGAISGSVGNSPGGPVALSTNWSVSVPAQSQGALTARLDSLSLNGAGISAGGGLGARMNQAGADPALEGNIDIQVQDWARLGALAGTPLSGAPAGIAVTLSNTQGRQAVTANATIPNLKMQERGSENPTLLIQKLTAQANVSDLYGAPGITLNLHTGQGLAGPLTWISGEGSVRGDSGRGQYSFALHNAPIRGKKASDRLNLQGSYDLNTPEVLVSSLLLSDPQSNTGVRLLQPLTVNLAKGMRIDGLQAAFLPSGTMNADIVFAPGNMSVSASINALSFTFMRMFAPDASLPRGTLSAQAKISTGRAGPQGSFNATADISAKESATGSVKTAKTTSRGTPIDGFALTLNGELSRSPGQPAAPGAQVRSMGGILWLRGNGSFGSAAKADAEKEGSLAFQIPLSTSASGIPSPASNAPLAAGVHWKGPIEALWLAVPVPDMYLSGPAQFDAYVTGTMNNPHPSLTAFTAGMRFEEITNGILIDSIDLEARSPDTNNVRLVVAADDGKDGTLALEADLTDLKGRRPQIAMRGQLNTFKPVHRDDLFLSVSGIVGVNGPLAGPKVTGNIRVDEGELSIDGNFGGSVTTLDTVSPEEFAVLQNEREERKEQIRTRRAQRQQAKGTTTNRPGGRRQRQPAGPTLDIHLAVPQNFFIRGRGLESEWKGDLTITGSAGSPSLVGALNPIRGYFDFLSRTFQFTGGDIQFSGGTEINPALSLVLTYEGPDITAFLRTSGTANRPEIALDSQPPLPQDEVLAHVLFGKSASSLNRYEALQLANGLAQLSGGSLGPDVLGGLRKTTGLDMLRIGGGQGEDQRGTSGLAGEGNLAPSGSSRPTDAGMPTLEAGKYLTDEIFVGVEQGLTTDSTAVRVEVQLSPKTHLEGKTSTQSSEVGVGWKLDY